MENKSQYRMKNWAENYELSSDHFLFPENVHQVQEICRDKKYRYIKAVGTRHSFNEIADTMKLPKGTTEKTAHVCLDEMQKIYFSLEPLEKKPTVTFEGGVTFTTLAYAVEKAGYALQNMASLPHIGVIGALITATHGSGHKYPIMTKNVVSMDIVHADGKLVTYDRSMPEFAHYLINFGALGIVVNATMLIEPNYHVAKGIYKTLTWDTLHAKFDEIMHSADNISMFTDWKEPRMTSVWVGQRYDMKGEKLPIPAEFFGSKHIEGDTIHPDGVHEPINCTTAGHGSWVVKSCYFLPEGKPSSEGNEMHIEYYLPYKNFLPAK